MTKYFVDEFGVYIGAFCGAEPPEGAIQVPAPPADARQLWNGSGWLLLAPSTGTRQENEDLRLQAYANPTTGSDRYFAEVARLQAMGGSEEEIEAARSAGVARYLEIQALYPWPDDPAHQPQ